MGWKSSLALIAVVGVGAFVAYNILTGKAGTTGQGDASYPYTPSGWTFPAGTQSVAPNPLNVIQAPENPIGQTPTQTIWEILTPKPANDASKITAPTAKSGASYLGASVITSSGFVVQPTAQSAAKAAGNFIIKGAPQISTSAQATAALMGKSYYGGASVNPYWNIGQGSAYKQVSSFTAKGDSRSYVYQNVGGVVQKKYI